MHFGIFAVCTLAASQIHAQVFSPSDAIVGGQIVDGSFVVGTDGFDGDTNNWPPNESPDHAIDGVGQKYLNFGKENTGFLVTPAGGSSVATKIKLWTANDEEPRDPGSFELWGTHADVSGGGPIDVSGFTLIASGDLALPSSRNDGGDFPLLHENSQVVAFSNTDAYASYLLNFPTLKDAGAANSMQIAEVQLNVPKPATVVLALLLLGLAAIRR